MAACVEAFEIGCTWRDVTRALRAMGYRRDRARGSHAQYKLGSRRVTVVENHPGERIAPCLVHRINKQIGVR